MQLVSKAAESATSPESRNALPEAWIDRLFDRFQSMYGRHWVDMWAPLPGNPLDVMRKVKAVWAEDLAGCTGEQIRRAIDHCRANLKFPPTSPEFVGICRSFRERPENQVFLPAPRGEMDAEVQAKVSEALGQPKKHDPRQWARTIIERAAQGIVYPPIAIENAKEALTAPAYQ